MSRVSKMSMQDILNNLKLVLRQNDIAYFCDNIEVIKEFIKKHNTTLNNPETVKQFLIDVEEYIDKEKFVLLTLINHIKNLVMIKERMNHLKKQFHMSGSQETLREIGRLELKAKEEETYIENTKELGKEIETIITFYYYDEKQKRYRIDVADSREIIDGKKINTSKALKRFDEVDSRLKNTETDEALGMEFILQSILLTDLGQVFPTEQFGNDVRMMILENRVLKKGTKTREELEKIKTIKTYIEYTEFIDNIDFLGALPDIKATLREYAEYIDMDKLLLISAYRFQEGLEDKKVNPELYLNLKEILQTILENIKSRKAQISCGLQNARTYEVEQVNYSIKDLRKCLSRFTQSTYVSLKEIEEYKEKAGNKEIILTQIPDEYMNIIFTAEELEKLSTLSEENLIYVSQKLEWNTEQILNAIKALNSCSTEVLRKLNESEKITSKEIVELYELNIISLQDVNLLKDTVDLSNSISFDKLNEYYKELKINPEDKELLSKYNKYLSLYKEVLLQDKSAEEIQETSNIAMGKIVEDFEEEVNYNEAIKNYYRAGIITLDSIAEWSNEELITLLFNEKLISIQDVGELVKKDKLSASCVTQICQQEIWNSNLTQEQRVEILLTGWLSQETIETLYRKTLINNEDLRKLVDNNIINEKDSTRIIESLGIEEAEANSSICLIIDDGVKKINNNGRYVKGTHYYPGTSYKNNKVIILPDAREEFFKLLGAVKVRTSKIDDNSPFSNYDFYAILGKDGKIHLDSPIIAERYFEDKETESIFATDNATYFFRYADLMVLSNYAKKDEVVNKKENVVFRSSHTVANENRNGRWASSVIGNVVRTSLSSDLKEYNKGNQGLIILEKIKEMYSPEQIRKIFEFEKRIDSGEYSYEIITEKEGINMDDDDNDQR